MNGSRRSVNSCIRNLWDRVERAQLDCAGMSSRRTCFSVQCRVHASDDGADADTGDCGRPAGSERAASTLRAKNNAKLSTLWSVALDTSRSRPSRDDSEHHNSAEERPHCVSLWRQYASFFQRCRLNRRRCFDQQPMVRQTVFVDINAQVGGSHSVPTDIRRRTTETDGCVGYGCCEAEQVGQRFP